MKEWQFIEEDVNENLKREIANRPVRKAYTIDFRMAYYTDEEKECAWLISKKSQGLSLNRDKENGNYIIFIQPDDELEAIAFEFEKAEDIHRIIDKIILNVQIAKTFGKKMEAPNGERICLEGINGYRDEQFGVRLVRDESQILLDGKPLETTRKAGDILLEHANVGQNGENVLDFQAVGYLDSTQVCLTRRLYDNQMFLTDEQKKGIVYYKNDDFSVINALLRGGEANCNKILDKCLLSNSDKSLTRILNYILNIDEVARALPPKKYDIILHRQGSGFGKSMQEGSENRYDSFVSFATNEGMRTGGIPGGKYVAYQCLFKKDDIVIPIELLCPYVLKGFYPECELFALPFSYEVEKYIEENRKIDFGRKHESLVVMGNKKDIPIKETLDVRLQELRKHVEKLIKDREYIDTVLSETQSEESTKRYNAQGYTELQGVEQISLLKMLNSFRDNEKLKDAIEFDKKIQNDPNQYKSYTHGANHTRRVGFFARVIGENIGLSKEDMELLLYAVQNHDIGRTHDLEDKEHGKKSVERLKQIRKENNSDKWESNKPDYFSFDDRELIFFMIENHSKGVRENEQAILSLPKEKQDRYRLMLNCLKDADKLDRIRLGKYDGLDATRLQLPFSQKIVRMAYEVNDAWLDIADKLLGKKYNLDTFMVSVDESIKIVQDRIQNPVEVEIEKRPLEYYDDLLGIEEDIQQEEQASTEKVGIETTSEEVLEKLVEKSKKQTTMFSLNRIIANVKNSIGEFFKGKKDKEK